MEFFIPGIVLFILFLFVAFYFAPKATPMIAAILSIIFLIYGVREHSKMFASEYRLSTWQDGLKMYAPAIMIIVIIIFVIYSIMAFFTGGSVPVPSMPNVEMPTMNGLATNLTNSLNTAKNTIADGLNFNGTNKGNNRGNNRGNNNSLLDSLMNNNTNTNNRGNNKNKNNGSFRRSMLETF
jgi:hypothetical protein